MSLILATGSNIGDKKQNLEKALQMLKQKFEFIAASRIYHSDPVEYFDQDDFYNQVLEFQIPDSDPRKVFDVIKNIEKKMGREKVIPKGPRNIDIDIIFWGLEKYRDESLIIPHPAWSTRSFVVLPLKELPYWKTVEKNFEYTKNFDFKAIPIA
ncbi:MAG: 2-amino-4-hydroxy-6-hydroxymethyldihydropteridine diphosphokinase [Halobacteriovoraceae bacterium]|nr:2-amino-4-hydroxy-6-hydroxymethyldihydropteridine diphosphokinase [Halobacteriovoraceae bacterium]